MHQGGKQRQIFIHTDKKKEEKKKRERAKVENKRHMKFFHHPVKSQNIHALF